MPRQVHTLAVPEALATRIAQVLMEFAHAVEASGTDLSQGRKIGKTETQEYADAQALYKLVRSAKNERKAHAQKQPFYDQENAGLDLDESY